MSEIQAKWFWCTIDRKVAVRDELIWPEKISNRFIATPINENENLIGRNGSLCF